MNEAKRVLESNLSIATERIKDMYLGYARYRLAYGVAGALDYQQMADGILSHHGDSILKTLAGSEFSAEISALDRTLKLSNSKKALWSREADGRIIRNFGVIDDEDAQSLLADILYGFLDFPLEDGNYFITPVPEAVSMAQQLGVRDEKYWKWESEDPPLRVHLPLEDVVKAILTRKLTLPCS